MAAEIGTASAVLQLTSTAVNACIKLHGVISTLKNAPKEILHLSSDLTSLSALLKNLQVALESRDAQTIIDQDVGVRGAMGNLRALISSCHTSCIKLHSKLQAEKPSDGSTEDEKVASPKEGRDVRRSIWWLFNRKGIFASLDELQRTKFLLSDSMGSITFMLSIRTAALRNEDTPRAPVPFDDDAGSAIINWLMAQPSEAEPVAQDTMSTHSTTLIENASNPKPSDPHMTEELLAAVRRGTIPVVNILLNQVDVNAQDPRTGRTALSIAAETGDVKMATHLLEHGASVFIRQYSRTCWEDDWGPHYLAGRVPLHWAASGGFSEVVALLLKHGANPNSVNSIGRPALQDACWSKDLDSVRVLLDHGADVNFRSFYYGWRAINQACDQGQTDLIKLLLKYKPLLDVTVAYGGDNKSPLHCAIVWCNFEIMKALLDEGADPNMEGLWEKNTPLHLAAAGGWIEGVKLLVDFGASIDPVDCFLFETPLHKAARNLEEEVCRLLCDYGADTEKRNVDGQDYRGILECARRYPEEWKVREDRVYFLSF